MALEGRLPKNAQSWNLRLVEAFEARAATDRAKGRQRWFTWQQDAQKIKEVRKHIYQQVGGAGAGTIKHLPTSLTKRGSDVATSIIFGRQAVINGEQRRFMPGGDSYVAPSDMPHPYLSRMQGHKGAYAILMAFHVSGKTRMNKHEIIKRAQPYSVEEMKPDFHRGRVFAGWKGIASLEKYELVQRAGNYWSRQAHQCD